MDRRTAIKALAGGGVFAVVCDINGLQPAAADGEFVAAFDFNESTFTGTITEPDGTVNNLTGYHAAGELPPLGGEPCAGYAFSGAVNLPQGFTVPAGEVWELDPSVDTTITVSANIVVNGTLRAHPLPGVTHRIRFVGINESAIVGGHAMHPIASDVGLWVDGGVLDIAGTQKRAWNRTGQDVTWMPGDELIVTPTAPGAYVATPFVAGSPVPTASTATMHAGTSHEITRTYSAEVVNLTRNVIIESVGGRAHIMFINCQRAQRLSHASLVNLGPSGKMGRYPLHLHMCGDGVDGSNFRGNVARDCGNHAFVTHLSHGCDHSDSIAYRTTGSAFWWDGATETNRCIWNRCGAIETKQVGSDGDAGFFLGQGTGNSCVESFATGTSSTTAGFLWPSHNNTDGHVLWAASGCVSHNNPASGVRSWQNDANPHTVIDFVTYRNGGNGITHGAYTSRYRYFHCVSFGNIAGDFVAKAVGDWLVSNCWLETFAIVSHTLAGGTQVVETNRNWPIRSVTVDEGASSQAGHFVFMSSHFRSDLKPTQIAVSSQASVIDVVNKSAPSFTLTP